MSLRRAVLYCLIAASVFSVAFSILRIGWWPFEPLTAFLIQATLFLAVAAVSTLRARRYLAGALLAASAIAGFAHLLPFARNETIPVTKSACCLYVKIGHANLFSHGRGVPRVRKWAAANDIEILELTELPGAETFDVKEAFPEFPYILVGDQRGLRKVAILSKLPLRPAGDVSPATLSGTAKLDGHTTLTVVSTHPTIAMTPHHMNERDKAIRDVFAAAAQHSNAVVIGDFNATPWSPVLANVSAHHGFTRHSGGVFQSTWVTPFPALGIPIDHIYLSSGLGVYETGGGPFILSDHWPIYAEISVPAGK
jgi:endonuclease/exonuclease/phosphatase (EEP) superfamily protein YafD